MKRKFTICKVILTAFCLLNLTSNVFAQGDVAEIIRSGREDAGKLAVAYMNPFFKGLGFGMNSGWFNSAKTKNLGKFDLKIQATAAFVPGSDRSFDISKLGLSSNTRLKSGESPITPTAFGDDVSGSTLQLYGKDNPATVGINEGNIVIGEFDLPEGSGFHIVPSPQVQLTVGLIKNTDVTVRFTPKIDGGDFGKIGSWGIGIKKEITTLLPGKSEKVIPVDISLAFGYNQINYDKNIAVEDQVGENQSDDLKQRLEGEFSGFTVDAILSKKLALFTPFVSVGYNTAKTKFGILGDYVIKSGVSPTDTETIKDPVQINRKDIAGLRANVGFSLHLAFFRLYGAYNIGEYQAVTAGIGFGIGK